MTFALYPDTLATGVTRRQLLLGSLASAAVAGFGRPLQAEPAASDVKVLCGYPPGG